MSHRPSLRRSLVSVASVVVLAVLTACGSSPAATQQPASSARGSVPPAVITPGPAAAGGLCGAIAAELAIAALGVPNVVPAGGDVVPRGNGIYCRYSAATDGNTNVDAQLRDMTRAEFETLADTIGTTTPLPGMGEVAFSRSTATMGIPGAAVAAWSGGRGVTVNINRAGDQAAMLAAAQAIAAAVLLSNL